MAEFLDKLIEVSAFEREPLEGHFRVLYISVLRTKHST